LTSYHDLCIALEEYYDFNVNGYVEYGIAFESENVEAEKKRSFFIKIKERLMNWCGKMYDFFNKKAHSTKNKVLKKIYEWAARIFYKLSGRAKQLSNNQDISKEAEQIKKEGEDTCERVKQEEQKVNGASETNNTQNSSSNSSSSGGNNSNSNSTINNNSSKSNGSTGLTISDKANSMMISKGGKDSYDKADRQNNELSVQYKNKNDNKKVPPKTEPKKESTSKNSNSTTNQSRVHVEDGSDMHKVFADVFNLSKDIDKYNTTRKLPRGVTDSEYKKFLNNERNRFLSLADRIEKDEPGNAKKIRNKLSKAVENMIWYCNHMMIGR